MTSRGTLARRGAASAIALLLAINLGGAVFAVDPDIHFANSLLEEFGYTDLAVDILLQAATGPKSKEAKAEAHLALSDVYSKMAQTEGDPAKRQGYFDKAADHMKKFNDSGIKTGSGDMTKRIAEMKRQQASALKTEANKDSQTAANKAELLRKAADAFGEAVQLFKDLEKREKKEYDKAYEDRDNIDKKKASTIKEAYGTIWFERLRTEHMQAEAMPKGGGSRNSLLEKVIKELEEEFTSEFAGWGFEFYGKVLMGACQSGAGKYAEAIQTYDELLADIENVKAQRTLGSLMHRIYYQKAGTYLNWAETGGAEAKDRFKKAAETIKELFRNFSKVKRPSTDAEIDFYSLCIELQAKGYAGVENYGRALKNIAWIYDNGSAGWKNRVAPLVEDWCKKAPTATAYFISGRSLMKDSNYDQAIVTYAKALVIADKEELETYGKEAWNYMAISFYNQGRFYEAWLAFAELAKYEDMEKKALRLRVKAMGKQFKEGGKDNFDRRLWLESMLVLITKYPDDDTDMRYLIAEQYRVLEDVDNAIVWYRKVPQNSEYLSSSKYRMPMMVWRKYKAILKDEDATASAKALKLADARAAFEDYAAWNTQALANQKDENKKKELVKNAAMTDLIISQAAIKLAELPQEEYAVGGQLVAHWKFDETEGTTALDAGGVGIDGSLVGEAAWIPEGKVGGGVAFGGSGHVALGETTALDLDSQLSITAWVCPAEVRTQRVFQHGDAQEPETAVEYAVSLRQDGRIRFEIQTGSTITSLESTSFTYQPNTWLHVCGTWDGREMELYIDGELNNSVEKEGTIDEVNNIASIGYSPAFTEFFKGKMDDIRIYGRAISAADVKDIATNDASHSKQRNLNDVLSLLDGFEDKYALNSKSFPSVQISRLQALYTLLGMEEDGAKMDSILQALEVQMDRLQKGKSKLAIQGFAVMANAYLDSTERAANEAKKTERSNKAAEYFEKLLNYDPDQKKDMYLWVADQFLDMGKYERAVKILEDFLKEYGAEGQITNEEMIDVRRRFVTCYMKMKDYDKAIGFIEKVLAEPGWETDWHTTWDLINACIEKGKNAPDEEGKGAGFGRALEKLLEMTPLVEAQSTEWFEIKKRIVEIDLHMEDYLDAMNRVDLLDQLYLWGTQKNRDSIADMLDQFAGKIEDDALKDRWKVSTAKLRKEVKGLPAEVLKKKPADEEAPDEEIGDDLEEVDIEEEQPPTKTENTDDKKPEPADEANAEKAAGQ